MQQRSYSLKKRLIWFTGIFSVVLGCILMVSSYKVALQEINEILDKQMRFQAERVAAEELRHQQSNFDPNRKYSEEDLFVDIWSYRELAHQQHPNQVLMPVKVPQAGFYEHPQPLLQPPFSPKMRMRIIMIIHSMTKKFHFKGTFQKGIDKK